MRALAMILAAVALVAAGYVGRVAIETHASAPDPNGAPVVCRGGQCWQAGERVRRPRAGAPCLSDANSAWQSVGAERGAVHNAFIGTDRGLLETWVCDTAE